MHKKESRGKQQCDRDNTQCEGSRIKEMPSATAVMLKTHPIFC
jgi:hypothetical protein